MLLNTGLNRFLLNRQYQNKINNYFFERFSSQRQIRKHKQYAAQPLLYKQLSQIAKKIDFKSDSLKFPISVPLKFRWVYRPEKHLIENLKQHDQVDFKDLSGNQILLHLENAQHLRLTELVNALGEVAKRDPNQQLNLKDHPWIVNAKEVVKKEIFHFNQRQFTYLMLTYYRLGIQDEESWVMFENNVKKFMNKILAKGFGIIFNLAFSDNGKRFSKQFRQELALLLPIHLRNLQPIHVGQAMRYIYDEGLMTDHLFENHFHQMIWRRTIQMAKFGQLPLMFSVLRDMKYENDEFLYPDIYKVLAEQHKLIPVRHMKPLQDALEDIFQSFPNHSQYQLGELIQKIEVSRQWNEGLGGQAKSISLISMVQNDLKQYAEKLQQKRI